MTPPAVDDAPQPLPTGERRGASAGFRGAVAAALIGRRTDPFDGLPEEQAARIRAAQVAGVVRLTPLSMAVNLLNTGLVALVFWSEGPRWMLAAWSLVLALLAAAALRSWHAGKRRRPREAASRRATARATAHAVLFASVWGVAPLALFPTAGPFERFVFGCMATGMIAGGAFALSGVPRAGLAYTWIMCGLTAAGMVATGEAAMAVSAAVLCFYAAIISRNLVQSGDLFAANLRGRSEIEAQRELLGLLLRDFEESAGDCLWETDAAGRLRRCPPRLARMLGLDPDAAAGAVLPDLLGRGAAALAAGGEGGGGALRDGPAARFAARDAFRDALAAVPAAGGGERVLSLSAKPVVDSAGAFAGFRGVASDVTERVKAEADLARTRAFLDAVVENVPAILFAKDMGDDGRYVLLNRAGERLLGLPRAAVVGKTDRDLFPPDEAARFAANDRRALAAAAAEGAAGRCVLEEAALAGQGGEVRHLRTSKLALADGAARGAAGAAGPAAAARYVLGFSEDVTERKRDEERLREQHRRLDAALTNMSQGLCMFGADARLVVHNERFLELFDLPAGAVRPGQTHREVVGRIAALGRYAGNPCPDEICRSTRAPAGRDAGPATVDRALADGRTLAVTIRAMAGGGWVTTFEDVTERRRAEARIAHMARHDALTGLPNRLCFHERLEELLRPSRRGPAAGGAGGAGGGAAVLWIDLDRFKNVNDTLGHPAGDALLKAVAGRIAAATRSRGRGADAGATVARLGGDEFAVALPVRGDGRAARADAAALAARLVSALNEPFEIDGHQVAAGASVGVALAPEDGDRPDRLLKAADLALYRAKAEGRGTFRSFEPEMDRHARERRAMETDLRRALAAGEFEVHYQPLLDLRTDRVSGFEALLRWNHPERGRVPPAEFVPVAEEIGLIAPIGEWVLRTACAEAAAWPGGLKVAVNLSPAQFKGFALVPSVAGALAASGLPPDRLELEITETVLLERSEHNAGQLHRLRALGARVALDDFGTGYSSLSHLRSFPFDKIKIDRSFVRDLEGDGEGGCAAIVRAVAGLGASLGVCTTAEGVETAAQLAFVRAEGCTEVQGYHLSPPRPAAEIGRMLRAIGSGAAEVAAAAR